MSKYLLASDGSDCSLEAARYLLNIASAHKNIEVIVLSVKEIAAWFTESIDEVAEMTAAPFREAGVKVKVISREGDPAQVISDTADELDVDHIVLGARGLSRLKGVLMGSVSQKVIYLCQCPVTIVKKRVKREVLDDDED